MKKINKSEPDFYKNSLKEFKPKKWGDVPNKFDIRVYMLCEEQNFQCAYTEQRIEPENSHIDHYIKQSFILQGLFKPTTIFSWNNLFASCNDEYFGAKHKDKYIKHVEYQPLINPCNESYEKHFKYSWLGDVFTDTNDAKGNNTIRIFNLNDSALVEQRRIVAHQVKIMYKQFTLKELIGIIGKFESMICYLYQQLNKLHKAQ